MAFFVSFLVSLALGQSQAAPAEIAPAAATPAVSAVSGEAPAAPSKTSRQSTKALGVVGSNATAQMFSSGPLDKAGATTLRGDSMATMSMNNLAAQRVRARKAADLINAGHCREAMDMVVSGGDGLLARNVAKVCGMPEPTIR